MRRASYLTILFIIIFGIPVKVTGQLLDLVVQTGHSDIVSSVAFSPDGRLLASCGQDSMINLWEVATGREIKAIKSNTRWVFAVKFSPNGKLLATGGSKYLLPTANDGIVTVWDIESGKIVKTFSGHNGPISDLAFSPDGSSIASASEDKSTKLWSLSTGGLVRSFDEPSSYVTAVAFSPDGKTISTCGGDRTIKLWEISSGALTATLNGHSGTVKDVAFSPNGQYLLSGGWNSLLLWDLRQKSLTQKFDQSGDAETVAFSPDGTKIASGGSDKTIKIWDRASGRLLHNIEGHTKSVTSLVFSPNGLLIASASNDFTVTLIDVNNGATVRLMDSKSLSINSISTVASGAILVSGMDKAKITLWDLNRGAISHTLAQGLFLKPFESVKLVSASPDGKLLASISYLTSTITLWDVSSGLESTTLRGHFDINSAISFSPDGKMLASAGTGGIELWDVATGTLLRTFRGHTSAISDVTFSPNGELLASACGLDTDVLLWNVSTGSKERILSLAPLHTKAVSFDLEGKRLAIGSTSPTLGSKPIIGYFDVQTGESLKRDVLSDRVKNDLLRDFSHLYEKYFNAAVSDHLVAELSDNVKVKLYSRAMHKELASLIALNDGRWIVATPEGRFDTNLSLDNITGLHWVISDQPFRTYGLELFARQYYEPGLLRRIVQCDSESACEKEFLPLPSVNAVNRLQPKVKIANVMLGNGAVGSVDVIVEISSSKVSPAGVTVNSSPTQSGAFDLRLFRDDQLVADSTPKERLVTYIADAPSLIDRTSGNQLTNTLDDRAWRKAFNLFTIKAPAIKILASNKVQYTFHNVKLPQNGRREVKFTAYAFNSDRVKSATTEPYQFIIPAAVASVPRKGRAFLISIGVNASENSQYNLRYAANDARKMQEIVGARLKADPAKYAEVIPVPLISDHGADNSPTETTARKAIIKGVFSLLAGHAEEVPAEVLAKIPNRDKLTGVQPEDTLIITYSGHGYTDRSGIFYMVPFDNGIPPEGIQTAGLSKLISSDELSLWMQDITANEMIMIIDACHSNAAIQGNGFKPGPMGSRGLGQLAYDKDMKILSATQADNVALELDKLEQGLLTYALLQDGVLNSHADKDNNKQLLSTEWLSYAEQRVPELYQEIIAGKRSLVVNGKSVRSAEGARLLIQPGAVRQTNLDLQQPSLFDFKRRKTNDVIFNLP